MESIGGMLFLVIDGVLMAGLIAVLCLGDRTPFLSYRPARMAVLSVLVAAILGLGVGYLSITAQLRNTREQKDIFAPTAAPTAPAEGAGATSPGDQPGGDPGTQPAR